MLVVEGVVVCVESVVVDVEGVVVCVEGVVVDVEGVVVDVEGVVVDVEGVVVSRWSNIGSADPPWLSIPQLFTPFMNLKNPLSPHVVFHEFI